MSLMGFQRRRREFARQKELKKQQVSLEEKNVKDLRILAKEKGIEGYSDMTSDVPLKDFRKLNNAGEKFLTESGVYKLAFKSEKPKTEKFTDWVTDEVLPTIRKTGAYITNNADPEMLRSEANEIETVNILNETAKIILPTLDEAGLKPQCKALTLKLIYEKAGLRLPIEGLKADREIFDLTTIAEILVEKVMTKPSAFNINVKKL